MIHVWGWDPGMTTGWCHLSVHDDDLGVFDCGEADHLQVGNMLYDNPSLMAAVSKPIEVVFVVEKFTMSPGKTQQPWSLETTGLIRYFATRYHIEFVEVRPSEHKPLIKDEVVKRAGLWQPGQGHAMDSVRCVMYYLIKERGLLRWCLRSDTEIRSG